MRVYVERVMMAVGRWEGRTVSSPTATTVGLLQTASLAMTMVDRQLVLGSLAAFVVTLLLSLLFLRSRLLTRSERNLARHLASLSAARPAGRPLVLGLFHPFCNAGGGGERVLWTAVEYMQRTYGDAVVCVIYTGDWPGVSKQTILDGAMVSSHPPPPLPAPSPISHALALLLCPERRAQVGMALIRFLCLLRFSETLQHLSVSVVGHLRSPPVATPHR